MENDIAISVQNITKQFYSTQLNYALSNVSFQLKKGNVLGLIGNNGAGKSTLLKTICGLTKPDSGTVSYNGRLSYILDIGSCFHPDLSGLDNIFLVGRINGFTNAQIKQKLDSIIEFSELQNFINTPLKYYSNGMYLRLAFTTNTTFYSDILLLDEIMGVGDLHFQQKAKERINQIVTGGTTVIMTGHNLEELSVLCSHGLWLSSGRQLFFGEINEAVDKYLTHTANAAAVDILPVNNLESGKNGNGSAGGSSPVNSTGEITYTQHFVGETDDDDETMPVSLIEAGVRTNNKPYTAEIHMDDQLEIVVRYKKRISGPTVLFIVIKDKFGHNLMILCANRVADESRFIDNTEPGTYAESVSLPSGLFNQGVFSISIYFRDGKNEDIAIFKRSLFFKVYKSEINFGAFSYKDDFSGSLMPIFDWNSKKEL
jgi:ABC-2 type transport system ATP-binding protein